MRLDMVVTDEGARKKEEYTRGSGRESRCANQAKPKPPWQKIHTFCPSAVRLPVWASRQTYELGESGWRANPRRERNSSDDAMSEA